MWTSQRVSALSPDPASTKAAYLLADLRFWEGLGRDSRTVWGSYNGKDGAYLVRAEHGAVLEEEPVEPDDFWGLEALARMADAEVRSWILPHLLHWRFPPERALKLVQALARGGCEELLAVVGRDCDQELNRKAALDARF